jgi:hypothetical protein
MRYLLCCILFFFSLTGVAQLAPYDSSNVQARAFNESAINEYKKDRQFQYDKMSEPVSSFWDRFWAWFWRKIGELMANPVGNATVKIFFILLGIAAVVFFILKMTGDRTGLFGTRGKKGLSYEIGEEDIHSISFDDAIQDAVSKENYRLAVRLVYLYSLKLLSDRALIDWKPGKTNTAYVYELKQHAVSGSFSHLTTSFEHAWYGGETVDREHYRDFENSFQEFKTRIS